MVGFAKQLIITQPKLLCARLESYWKTKGEPKKHFAGMDTQHTYCLRLERHNAPASTYLTTLTVKMGTSVVDVGSQEFVHVAWFLHPSSAHTQAITWHTYQYSSCPRERLACHKQQTGKCYISTVFSIRQDVNNFD